MRNIKRLTALDQDNYTQLYQPALFKMIEATQLIPASASYHHTEPGGLIKHTVAVIEYALEERTRHILPELSDVETQAKEKHIWTYAIFAAAILHDAGKLLTQQSIVFNDKTTFSPFVKIQDLPQDLSYTLHFNKLADGYRIHKQIAATFFGLFFPQTAQTWLSQSMHVFDELTAFIQGIEQHSGSIGKIIQYADSRSVAENIGIQNSSRFIGATPPLAEKIILAIRQIIPMLGVNKPGAAIFKKGNTAYILSNTLAEKVKEWLKNHGESVPHDNNRIFDELENFGYALRGKLGIVQWITVKMAGFEQRFSVICFDIRRIYHESTLPKDIIGDIIVNAEKRPQEKETVAVSQQKQTAKNTQTDAEINNIHAVTVNPPTETEKTQAETASSLLSTLQDINNTKNEDVWGVPIASTQESQSLTQTVSFEQPISETESHAIHTETDGLHTQAEPVPSDYKPKTFVPFDPSLLPEFTEDSLLSKETGEFFIKWLKLMIKHRRFEINENDSPVHKISANLVGLMTPKIFMLFCNDYNLTTDFSNNAPNQIRNAVKKAGYLIQHANAKKEIFRCQVVGQKYELYFCLINEIHLLEYGITIAPNQTLVLKDVPKVL